MNLSKRPDRRDNEEIRQTKISYGELACVDGSARFSFGDIAALASLSAPIQVRLAAEQPSKATFEVSIRPLSNVPATESKAMAGIIRSSLEPSLILTKNPRSLVQLVVQSLSPAGRRPGHVWTTTLAAAMINASTLAFLDSSSVPMCGIVTAVAVARDHRGVLVADPSDSEVEASSGMGCFAFMFFSDEGEERSHRSNCISASWKSSSPRASGGGYDEIVEAKELARRKAEEICGSMRASIANKLRLNDEIEEEERMVI